MANTATTLPISKSGLVPKPAGSTVLVNIAATIENDKPTRRVDDTYY